MASITKWDVLDSCSHSIWKYPAELTLELSKKHGRVSLAQVFLFIEKLEDAKYVVTQKVPDPSKKNKLRLGVKKTSTGIQARAQAEQGHGANLGRGLKPA